ncbi:MAG: hypothetical protein WC216_12060 [Gallionella sp.]|jgi:hypothetical protein
MKRREWTAPDARCENNPEYILTAANNSQHGEIRCFARHSPRNRASTYIKTLFKKGFAQNQKMSNATKILMEHGIEALQPALTHKVIHRFCG